MSRRACVILRSLSWLFIAGLLAFAGAATYRPPGMLGERAYCERLAPKYAATLEYRLWDSTRVDLYTADEAIEVDWAEKHYEAVGQATWYSIVTGRKPAVLLLIKNPEKEARYIYRCTAICERLDIKLYLENVAELPE